MFLLSCKGADVFELSYPSFKDDYYIMVPPLERPRVWFKDCTAFEELTALLMQVTGKDGAGICFIN